MEILHDHEVYRHVRFKRPNDLCMSFSLITVPGRLIYAGDMGSFVFCRTYDMFDFFSHGGEGREPNFSYWHEKLEAIDLGGSQEYDVNSFRKNLLRYLDGEGQDWSEDHREQIVEFIDGVCGTFCDDGPDAAFREVADFWVMDEDNQPQDVFVDFFECSNKRYALRYEWACHAIQWGVFKYRKAKELAASKEVSVVE